MRHEQRLRTRTPESRAFAERVQVVMSLTAQLNALAFDDLEGRRRLLIEIFGRPIPESLTVLPPFHCDHGLGATFGEQVFINQGCYFLDLGGITIGDRVLIGPRVTLSTAGHPVALAERHDWITHAPIVIEDDVWIGAGHHRAGRDDRARFGGRRGRGRGEGRPAPVRGDGHERGRAQAPRRGALAQTSVMRTPAWAL